MFAPSKKWALFAAAIACTSVLAARRSSPAQDAESPPRLFELRIYTTNEGKLDALNRRFREHTNELFVKHGMELVAYWTPSEGEKAGNTLIYVLAYPDREAREASWKAFAADPEWQAVFAESRRDGPLVSGVESTFMLATDYSPLQ